MTGNGHLRILPFEILAGLSRVQDTPRRPPAGSGGLKHFHSCDLAINLPPALNFSQHHPRLIKRLQSDWGELLAKSDCSTGNFAEALENGTPLGHVFGEILLRILDRLTMGLGLGFISIREGVKVIEEEETLEEAEDRVVYRIWVFYEQPLPTSVSGLENLVTGYLNACMLGEEFDIQATIQGMVDYRLKRPRRGNGRSSSRRPRQSGQQTLAANSGR